MTVHAGGQYQGNSDQGCNTDTMETESYVYILVWCIVNLFKLTHRETGGVSLSLLPFFAVPGSLSDVQVRRLGNNQVRVSWTPPTGVSRYVVTYQTDSDTSSVTTEDGAATDVTLADLEVNVAYGICIQAFAELPGPISGPFMVTLNGKDTILQSILRVLVDF